MFKARSFIVQIYTSGSLLKGIFWTFFFLRQISQSSPAQHFFPDPTLLGGEIQRREGPFSSSPWIQLGSKHWKRSPHRSCWWVWGRSFNFLKQAKEKKWPWIQWYKDFEKTRSLFLGTIILHQTKENQQYPKQYVSLPWLCPRKSTGSASKSKHDLKQTYMVPKTCFSLKP